MASFHPVGRPALPLRRLAGAAALLALVGAPVALAAQRPLAAAPPGGRGSGRPAGMASAARAAVAPVLDGRGDDPAWAEAPRIADFLEYEPNEGVESRFRTEAQVTYDDRNLYVIVRMHDPAPDSIVSMLARRDERVPSEQLKIVIDSYLDRRTAYQFAVNPAGVKRDFYVYNDNNEDPSWDAVWDVATAIDSSGWTAEFRIPFSQMRYADKPEHTFGLMIVRDIGRTGARISWPLYRRNVQGYVSQSGTIDGIRGIMAPRRIEIVPYLVTQNVTQAQGTGFRHPQRTTAGADLKVGLGPNLTLDATVNPDFGQVEADPAVLNLSAFEQFFSERRPFFLEGTGIFSYRVQCDDIDTGCNGLFYSRRIGRAPQLGGDFGDAGTPTATTILGAGKVTGRLGNGLSIGLLNAVTGEEMGTEGRAVEPMTNYAVGRLSQALNGGRSDLGLMVTATNRRLDETAVPLLRSDAYSGGVDARHRFGGDNYEIYASLTGSLVKGSAEAIARTQRDGVHNFQRPDDAIAYAPTRTSLAGDAQRISFSKFGGGITRFQTVYQRFSPDFEINDLGFLARADEQLFRNWFSLQFNRPTRLYQRTFHNFNSWTTWTAGGLPTDMSFNYNGHTQLRSFWWVHVGGNLNAQGGVYDDRASRGGPALRRSPATNVWAGVETDTRRRTTGSFFAGSSRGDAGRGHNWYVNPSVGFRIANGLSGSLGVNYSHTINHDQWRANYGDVGSDTVHHTFARLDQTTTSVTGRVNYTFSPSLSLQVYAQPFVSTGVYSDWRELDDPRAASYDDRFRPFTQRGTDPGGFRSLQFRSNTVLRWEYRPGSALFLVWAQGRQDFDAAAHEFDFAAARRELFTLHPENTLLLKVSYWINP